uniref:Uncharacterized protein n=1 Tax=Arundo donax TaxID=35708 RepID=A0A0A9EF39_ARUDO
MVQFYASNAEGGYNMCLDFRRIRD